MHVILNFARPLFFSNVFNSQEALCIGFLLKLSPDQLLFPCNYYSRISERIRAKL